MEAGKYVACEDANFVSQANLVECVIDATGVPDVGAKVATDAMRNKKHVVMLNVETDVVIGPYLKKLAEDLMEMSRVQLCICIASLKQWA